MILSKQSKRRSHQARLPITSQLSSYKINLYTHGKISDSLIKKIDQSSHRKPPKDPRPILAMQDQPWAQTPHTLPGRIREGMCKDRKNADRKVI